MELAEWLVCLGAGHVVAVSARLLLDAVVGCTVAQAADVECER